MPYRLPPKYRLAHDYAISLHDVIVGLLKGAAATRVFDVTYELKPGERAEMEGLTGESLYAWLEQNKGPEVTVEMDYKGVMPALIADFCNFVLEGLRCAGKGKLTIAYALFRKPFKDNLLYLEWLLVDPADFLTRFRQGAREIAVDKLSPDRKRELIAAAIDVCEGPGIDPDLIYEARYERRLDTSLAQAADQAVHLVTTWEALATEPQNFNFIFSGPEAWETQWANIYWTVPYLLHHATFVVEALIDTVARTDAVFQTTTAVRRAIGYELWAEHARGEARRGAYHSSLQALLEVLPELCRECGAPISYGRWDLRRLAFHGTLRCSHCKHAWTWVPDVST